MKIVGDVTNESVLRAAQEECIKKFGKLDILVNITRNKTWMFLFWVFLIPKGE